MGKVSRGKDPQKYKRRYVVILIGLIICLGLVVGLWRYLTHESNWWGDVRNLEDRYHYILSHVAPYNVHPFLRPVHFSVKDGVREKFAAGGTLVLDQNESPSYIVTASHLFSVTQPGSDYYDYHILGSKGYLGQGHVASVVVDQFRSEFDSNIICDIALCQIGNAGIIQRTSKVRISGQVAITEVGQVSKIDKKIILTSITTGEQYPLIGQMTAHTAAFWIMLYDSLPGESGSGFWGSDSNLYVLSGTVPIDKSWYEKIGIPKEYRGKRLTLATGTHIKW